VQNAKKHVRRLQARFDPQPTDARDQLFQQIVAPQYLRIVAGVQEKPKLFTGHADTLDAERRRFLPQDREQDRIQKDVLTEIDMGQRRTAIASPCQLRFYLGSDLLGSEPCRPAGR
jgi:hypothetical protein